MKNLFYNNIQKPSFDFLNTVEEEMSRAAGWWQLLALADLMMARFSFSIGDFSFFLLGVFENRYFVCSCSMALLQYHFCLVAIFTFPSVFLALFSVIS